jgi:hypothetical protein
MKWPGQPGHFLFSGGARQSYIKVPSGNEGVSDPRTVGAATAELSNSAATCDHGMRFVETPNSGATLMMKCS